MTVPIYDRIGPLKAGAIEYYIGRGPFSTLYFGFLGHGAFDDVWMPAEGLDRLKLSTSERKRMLRAAREADELSFSP